MANVAQLINTIKNAKEITKDFIDIAFGGAVSGRSLKDEIKDSTLGQVTKSASDYLKAPNRSPQNFIRSYEENLTNIGSARDSNFNLTRFLDKADDYEGLDPGMAAIRKDVIQGIDSESQITKRGMEGMLENFDATGKLYSGSNFAGETTGSPLVNFFSGTTDNALKDTAGILGTAALAGGVNTMMGGDFGDGMLAGGLAAFSARGISKAYMKNMGDMETDFMRKTLGADYTTAGTTEIKKGTPITNIPGEVKMRDLGFKTSATKSVSDTYKEYKPHQLPSITARNDYSHVVSPEQARRMNLQAISESDTKEAKAFIERKGPDRVMAHNRAMTIGGGMLAGVAFTGRSDKRDYRRGFNSHRGNRI